MTGISNVLFYGIMMFGLNVSYILIPKILG